jgi:hypothetical protein
MSATTEPVNEISHAQREEILRQIGAGNILCLSGGRVRALPDGIELPVAYGYRVRVRLSFVDDYTVQRVLVRAGQEFMHGQREGIYCDQVGESAYRAGMFRSYDDEEW